MLNCAGHLFELTVNYAAVTRIPRLLDVMCRYADLIARINSGCVTGSST
jgi:DUF1680 family protein